MLRTLADRVLEMREGMLSLSWSDDASWVVGPGV
jgi:hypothetical protein